MGKALEMIIKEDNLLGLLEKSKNPGTSSWEPISKEEIESFILIGKFEPSNRINSFVQSDINYWDNKYPISLNHQPNCISDIYSKNNIVYFVYDEFGGHRPEKRIRAINKDLII